MEMETKTMYIPIDLTTPRLPNEVLIMIGSQNAKIVDLTKEMDELKLDNQKLKLFWKEEQLKNDKLRHDNGLLQIRLDNQVAENRKYFKDNEALLEDSFKLAEILAIINRKTGALRICE